MLREHMIGHEGFVFQTRSGTLVSARNIERDTLRKMFVEIFKEAAKLADE